MFLGTESGDKIIALIDRKETEQIKVQENDKEGSHEVDYTILWEELKSCRTHFTRSGLLTGMFLGVAPSAWDISSDFTFADRMEQYDDSRKKVAIFSYFFISLPGIMLFLTGTQGLVTRLTNIRRCPAKITSSTCCKLLPSIILCFLVAGILSILFLVYVLNLNQREDLNELVLYYISIMTATYILIVKAMGTVFHGPEMKKLTVKISEAEGLFESSFQVVLVTFVWIKFGQWDSAMISSVVMIGKAGAENLLSFGKTNKLQDVGLLRKLCLLAKYIPVITLTACLRLGTMACILTTSFDFGLVTWQVLAGVMPFIILLLVKCWGSVDLTDLDVSDLANGVVAELSTFSLWGSRGREDSRNIQLWIGLYLLLLDTAFLSAVIHDQDYFNSLSGKLFEEWPPVEHPVILNYCAITSLCCGMVAYPLFIYQIYFMESHNMLSKVKILTLESQLKSALCEKDQLQKENHTLRSELRQDKKNLKKAEEKCIETVASNKALEEELKAATAENKKYVAQAKETKVERNLDISKLTDEDAAIKTQLKELTAKQFTEISCQTNSHSEIPYQVTSPLPPILGIKMCWKSLSSNSLPNLNIIGWNKPDYDYTDEAKEALAEKYDRQVRKFYEDERDLVRACREAAPHSAEQVDPGLHLSD